MNFHGYGFVGTRRYHPAWAACFKSEASEEPLGITKLCAMPPLELLVYWARGQGQWTAEVHPYAALYSPRQYRGTRGTEPGRTLVRGSGKRDSAPATP